MADPTPPDEDINPDDELHGLVVRHFYDERPKDDSEVLEIIAHTMRAINA